MRNRELFIDTWMNCHLTKETHHANEAVAVVIWDSSKRGNKKMAVFWVVAPCIVVEF
jgi:hypothetical protein